ncbi:D-3-phosphoglycerate dehydrogenase [Liquorilactobacillus sucicola DSM 21376 = JCM 15457]|uniref:Glycerate dehydrogenase n=1 Tax=Liquorilactobacillus sucicola DSM 21376 = JCM 15457 TaxID=1423806 RepID=A0A023CVV0_9LACO|nr:D-2-hydroxyacid dehydrogenase [Liquorilactobacillus sucicola]KRN05595.1 glycerate dehydrogenase [Liquorilactobacillus sucicola DSM 21376 = JCM 15457]GAJ25681.1 D-3-phosphoglycerate dehydrogenase [Liquorilactobacillus sucicola DSM 21376 = JCM 15457]
MKLVVLDGYALNPGDLSWEEFEKLGDLTVYDRTSYSDTTEILKRIGEAEIVFTNKTPIDRQVMEKAPNLKYIGVLATGYNVIDTEAAQEKNIIVTNIPAYGTEAVAQAAFALLLEITNQVGLHNTAVHEGEWEKGPDFTFRKAPLLELAGKTFGLIGFGRIAQATARIAHALGMKIIFYNHRPKEHNDSWAKQVSLASLLAESDIISLHIPQTKETTNFIDKQKISKMKNGVILLNTARGGLLNEKDVAAALNSGEISAAGVDVVSTEPIKNDNPLLSAKNCFITPHIAWAPVETRQRLLQICFYNIKAFLDGKPKNVVV